MVKINLLTKNGDGGDSCNRTCSWALGILFLGGKADLSFLKYLQNPLRPWLWRRSPHFGMWYSEWNRMSRDQTIPLLILMGEARLYRHLLWYLFGHILRLMLFTHNTRRNFVYLDQAEHLVKSTPDVPWRPQWKLPDLTGPEIWALEIRAMPLLVRTLLWPLLLVFDLETLVGAIVRRHFRPENKDVINHTLILINGKRRSPTPFMYLARKITNKEFLQSRLDAFFSEMHEPPLNILLFPVLNKFL